MNITLTPILENIVKQKVKSGHYASSSDFMREVLRFYLKNEEEKTELEKEKS